MSTTIPLMPQGGYFLCFAKESNQRKATPTIGPAFTKAPPSLRCSQKKRNRKNSLLLKQFSVLIALIFPLLGAN